MTPQRWRQVKETLADALERETAPERAAFLAVACADDTALRREVAALLDEPTEGVEDCVAHAVSGALLSTETTASPSSWMGRRIGAYELVRELGRGGMGAVWLARRADRQFEKLVAVKLLKRGTDTEEVLRRFRAERQILARLEHPNIAHLLDGGETDDGLPFFVLEYVAGEPVTRFCQEHKLSVAERLELFRKVCAAVQFAHQNLVVHRDLKPANILVTTDGEPKLLDFGIAKLLDDTDAANSGSDVTVLSQQRLTPAYASPEQVRGEAVTTVSDVYALGAILYELLSGASAHAFRTPMPSAEELQRVVVREEPARPSLRATDAETRRRLRGDLDVVILKALHKEPARRYPSVGGLAEDLRRHLEGRPVRARPDTWSYRTAKFVRRNKTAAAVGALVAAALLGSWAETLRETARARRRFEDVRQLAESFLFEFHDAIADVPGTVAARRLVAARGLQYLDSLASEAGGDHALQLELAEAYLKVGDVQGRPYTANLGDTTGALRSYEKAIEIVAPHATAETGSTTARRILSDGYERLGVLRARLSQPAAAAENHRRALALRTALLADDPSRAAEWQRLLVSSHLGLGDAIMAGNHLEQSIERYRQALEHYRRALPISEALWSAGRDDPANRRRLTQVCARIAAMLSEIAGATHDRGIFDEAFAFHERTLALNEAALQTDPGNAGFQRSLADELVMTAYARTLAVENLPAALAECRRALTLEQPLAALDATNAEARQDIAHARYVTGRVLQLQGDIAEAVKSYRECLDILDNLNAAHPDNVETTYDLSRARRGLAETTKALGNNHE